MRVNPVMKFSQASVLKNTQSGMTSKMQKAQQADTFESINPSFKNIGGAVGGVVGTFAGLGIGVLATVATGGLAAPALCAMGGCALGAISGADIGHKRGKGPQSNDNYDDLPTNYRDY